MKKLIKGKIKFSIFKNKSGNRLVATAVLFAFVTTFSVTFLTAGKAADKITIRLPENMKKIDVNVSRNDETTVTEIPTEEDTFISEEEKESYHINEDIGSVDVATGDSDRDEDGEGKQSVKDESINEDEDPGASIKPPEIPKPIIPEIPPQTTLPKPTEPKPTVPKPTSPKPTNPVTTTQPSGGELTPPEKTEFEYIPLKGLSGWQAVENDVFYIENGVPVKGNKTIGGVKYYFNNYGARASKVGIDVSNHNGVIDWKKVKASGVDYAIIRVGFRGYGESGTLKVDKNFEKNVSGAAAAGLDIGVYFYSQAITVKEALEEASVTVKYIRNHKIKYPVYFDTEYSGGRADSLSRKDRTKIAVAFCEAVKNEGYMPGIYASKSFYDDELIFSELSNYEIWVAHYTEQTNFKHPYRMWQYTCKGAVSGISGNVDVNIGYYDYAVKSNMSARGEKVVFVKDNAEKNKYLLAEAAVIEFEKNKDEKGKTTAMKAVNALGDERVKKELNSRIRRVDVVNSDNTETSVVN